VADSTTDKFNLKIHHCGLYVPDLESSTNWYRDIPAFAGIHAFAIKRPSGFLIRLGITFSEGF
jgi:catechol 2,3-dioxygenase-like lactoylglutathione lyase family enzyme